MNRTGHIAGGSGSVEMNQKSQQIRATAAASAKQQ
jgi:hypothetical protein